ncbi:hypothetical protein HMSSN036_56050 [Paenibacillus macerans]|nr:hypothetical protein HMSSN036_56050 [Paenibacillus macerans]
MSQERFFNWNNISGGNTIRLIRDAKANEFEITMFYVGLGDYHLNIERVAVRVRNGGHHDSVL